MRKLTHQEISNLRYSPDDLLQLPRMPVHAILDNIRSLYNVGSMFRTADGARVGKLWLTGHTPSPPRKEIEKTALGSTLTVPWEYAHAPHDVIRCVKSLGYRILLLEQTDSSVPYYTIGAADAPMCIVVGNEIQGVSREFVDAADGAMEIPMSGMKQSLNAAVAFGIAAFHFARVFQPAGPGENTSGT